MLRTIARKEVVELMRDGRLRYAAAIVLTLLVVSMAVGWRHYQDVSRQHRTAQQATRAQWLAQGEKNPHSAAHYGIYAFKPKLPLSFVDIGVDNYTGVSVWLEAHKQNEFKYRPAQDATTVQRFGELTPAWVLQLLCPLLIILLTFSTFAGEREQGTLRQVLSLGVPRATLLGGKALGLAAVLAMLLIPASILGAVALVLAADGGSIAPSVPRAGWLVVCYTLYFGAFLGIGLAVSATMRSSRAALLMLLGFWIVNGLVAPRLASEASKAIFPTPSAFEFAVRMERALKFGLDGKDTPEARERRFEHSVLKRYGVDRLEALPVSFAGLSLQAGEEHGNEIFDTMYADLWHTFARQHWVHQLSAVFAPLLAVRAMSMGLAGTDFDQHRQFATAAEIYRRKLVDVMNGEMTEKAGREDFGYISGPETWSKVPEFSYEAPRVGSVLGRERLSLGLLAAWCAAAWAAAAAGVARLRLV
jgi:ABC-2 type transport system permease protein